jgi:phosphatidate cytidylyltransferase
MKTRAITGIFFIAVMLGSMLAGPTVFSLFYLLLSVLCLQEFYKLLKQSGQELNIPNGLLVGGITFAAFASLYYTQHNYAFVALVPVVLVSIFVQQLFKQSATPFTAIAYTYLGLIFTIMPFCFFHALGFVQGGNFNFHLPLSFFILLWSNDTGAYLVGRFLGRTKLFERHSPKKTWEGFFGGVAIAAGVSLILSHYYPELNWRQWVSVAILIGCFGTLGDLTESMLKRSINIKDSGSILPGHGGLLDRFDGVLLSAPVVFTYLYFIFNL